MEGTAPEQPTMPAVDWKGALCMNILYMLSAQATSLASTYPRRPLHTIH